MSDDATRLAEAEAALHKLRTGGQRVRVKDASGREIQYQPAEFRDLEAYIDTLKRSVKGTPRRPRAAPVTF